MGLESGPPPGDPKNVVMGFPSSADGYGYQSSHMYPPPSAAAYPVYQAHEYYHQPLGHPHNINYPAPPVQNLQQSNPVHSDYYYYQQQQHYPNPLLPMPEPSGSSKFRRTMVTFMFFLVSSMCVLTFFVWYMFGSYVPEFEVVSMRVSNFSVRDTDLTGSWEVGLSIENVNQKLHIDFNELTSSIEYEDTLLGVAQPDPVTVPEMDRRFLNHTVLAAHQQIDDEVKANLLRDWGKGMVFFSLKLSTKSIFKSPSNTVDMCENIMLWCRNLQINVLSKGEGQLVPMLGNSCLMRVLKE